MNHKMLPDYITITSIADSPVVKLVRLVYSGSNSKLLQKKSEMSSSKHHLCVRS